MLKHVRLVRLALLLVLCPLPLLVLGWVPRQPATDLSRWTIRELSPLAYGRWLALDVLGGPHLAYDVGAMLRYARRQE